MGENCLLSCLPLTQRYRAVTALGRRPDKCSGTIDAVAALEQHAESTTAKEKKSQRLVMAECDQPSDLTKPRKKIVLVNLIVDNCSYERYPKPPPASR
jgi:hypothetical protein